MADQPCPVTSVEQVPLTILPTALEETTVTPTIKVPVVLAEPTLQIVVEATIPLAPAATEIKRVTKNVFLDQVKLVPVAFTPITGTDFFTVTRAKLFVAGHIRKDIEYATAACNAPLEDRIANVPFSGFADLTTFITPPVIGISAESKAAFLNETNGLVPRLDKFFFQNLVKYNEQPFGELVTANMFELDFSSTIPTPEGTFDTITEKIVLDLTVKVLQTQQLLIAATRVIAVPPPGTVG
ncbi:Uracil permease [Neobacillus novalis]|uniref:Uracil permease n=1 Tax=Neobacillus novalis TaxID=220687 RepID=A0AA95MPD5_9BACI|nr:Uracil permease [Neobacillus novalis]WHY85495.1 Uracil permease [Neobacillus novalis]